MELKFIAAQVNNDLYETAKELAAKMSKARPAGSRAVSVSEVIRQAIIFYSQNYEQDKK